MNDQTQKEVIDDQANRDPITNEPGSHPVGTGLGAAGAGTAGAIIGTALGGPLGGVAGAALGASVGGAWGHYAGEAANPTYVAVEPTLRESFPTRSYAQSRQYEDYEDAYAFGATERARVGSPWTDNLETDVRTRWDSAPAREGKQKLDWDAARPAVRDAWDVSDRSSRNS